MVEWVIVLVSRPDSVVLTVERKSESQKDCHIPFFMNFSGNPFFRQLTNFCNFAMPEDELSSIISVASRTW